MAKIELTPDQISIAYKNLDALAQRMKDELLIALALGLHHTNVPVALELPNRAYDILMKAAFVPIDGKVAINRESELLYRKAIAATERQAS